MPAPIVFDAFSRNLAAGHRDHDYVDLPTGFQQFFGRGDGKTVYSPDANALDIDIVRANARIAALIPRGVGKSIGTNRPLGQIGRGTTFSRAYPLIEEEFPVGAAQLLNRVVGSEGPYDRLTRQDRLRLLAREGYKEVVRRIVRTREFLAMQSIVLGTQSAEVLVAAPGANDYDWRRNAAHTVTAAQGWGNALGVALTDIDALCSLIKYNGKVEPDMMILGRTALVALLGNAEYNTSNYPNKQFYEFVRFTMDYNPPAEFAPFVAGGFKPVGKIRTPGGFELTVFGYREDYTNAGGAQTAYLNPLFALICSTRARCDRYYGPPETLPMTGAKLAEMSELLGFNSSTAPMPMASGAAVIDPAQFYADAYIGEDRKGLTVRCQAAPVFAPIQVDGFGVILNAGSP